MRIAVCAAVAAAAAVAATPSRAININDCSYASTKPVKAAVQSLDPAGVVKLQRGCRVSLTPAGGEAAVVLVGNAFPGSQLETRLRIFRDQNSDDEQFTKNVITRVPGLKNAYLVRELYKADGEIQLQTVMVRRAAKLIVLTNLGIGEHSTDTLLFLRPAQLYTLARLLR